MNGNLETASFSAVGGLSILVGSLFEDVGDFSEEVGGASEEGVDSDRRMGGF